LPKAMQYCIMAFVGISYPFDAHRVHPKYRTASQPLRDTMNEHTRATSVTGALLKIGELVILVDGRRATVKQILPGPTELHYSVALADGSQVEVEAGGLIKAQTYASWVAPGTDWDGQERREPGPEPEHRDDRRGEERRRP
jgi:hypothetical protein